MYVTTLRRAAFITLASILANAIPEASWATETNFPDKPITMVLGAAGGPSDVMARILADGISRTSNKSVIVENKPGAGGTIGAEYVRRAKPDGYTLLYGYKGQLTNAPLLTPDVDYSVAKDFKTVSIAAYPGPIFLVANAGLGVKDFDAFVKAVRDNPGGFDFSVSGPGVANSVAAQAIGRYAELSFTEIPFRSSTEATIAVSEGHADFTASTYDVFSQFMEAGKIVPLAVIAPERDHNLPEIPTVLELSLTGFQDTIETWAPWFSIQAPKDTPAEVIMTLNQMIGRALQDEGVQESYRKMSTAPPKSGQTPEAAHKEVVSLAEGWVAVLKSLGALK